MSELAWKINRIKAMGGREILFRGVQALSLKAEKIRFERGWQPVPSQKVGSRTFLFDKSSQTAANWCSLFSLDIPALENLLAGKIDFFGHAPLDVGNPVQWHRDPMTGIHSPADTFGKSLNYRDDAVVGNVKFLWELGRHQHLVPLASAYAVTGEQKYKDAVISQIEGWITKNPFNTGIHWCTALEVSLRLISWAVIHSLLHLRDGNDGLFTAAVDPEGLGKSIYQHVWFVAHFFSRYSSANNHLIGELAGILTGCLVFDLGMAGEKWAEQARKELENEAKKQVFPDGVNKEQATWYHLWVLEYLLFVSLVGRRADQEFTTDFHSTIAGMADFLHAITPAGGIPPQIGDADDGFVTRFDARWPLSSYEDMLRAVQSIMEKQLSEKVSQKAFWYAVMAGVDTDLQPVSDSECPVAKVYPKAFADGGYGVMGDDDVLLLFDAASLGYSSIAAHGHADALSFCLAVHGTWWLVDPGTYAYHSTPEWRNYFRGTAAHNTLSVDGRDQSEAGGPFLWVRHAPIHFDGCRLTEKGVQKVAGSHQGYSGIVHKRTVEFRSQDREIYILDTVSGTGVHELVLHFHFAPEINLQGNGKNGYTASQQHSDWILFMNVEQGWSWQTLQGSTAPIAGWYSPHLDQKIPAVELRGTWTGDLPIQVTTIIQVGRE